MLSGSRLFQNLRETQGYTYGAFSDLSSSSWPGLWTAWANAPAAQTGPAVEAVFGELRRLAEEPVSAEELERAKRGLIGSCALRLEKPERVLEDREELIQDGLPPDYWDTYSTKIQSVSAQDVRRVARRYLDRGVQVIAIGPSAKIEDPLRRVGPVQELDDRGDTSGLSP